MGELRQHHPSLKFSKVKALQKGDLLVVGDSPQDTIILQSESKVKAALGKNVRVSLPKAYQITKQKNKCLVVKGVPSDLTDKDFKEFLDLNKISYAKAERYKSKIDDRVLPMFQLEISDPAEAEALLSQNINVQCHRNCVQGGRISPACFGPTVLQLSMFRPLGSKL